MASRHLKSITIGMASAGHGLSTEMPPPSARLAYENQTETGGAATAEIALDECFRLAMHVPYFQLNDPIMLSVHAGCLHHLIELLLPPILELTAMTCRELEGTVPQPVTCTHDTCQIFA